MKIIHSELFNSFPEIIFGFSTKIGLDRKEPFFFNMSFTVGDDERNVKENREVFFNQLGLKTSQIAFQKQIHSDKINIVNQSGYVGESDAMITNHFNIGLAISTADCTPIFIYDKQNKVIAAIHSGWRSTQKRILEKTLLILAESYNSDPENLYVFIGPSISQNNYEVGEEFKNLFEDAYLVNKNGKLFLSVRGVNLDILKTFGVPKNQIEVSTLCTYDEKELLHSYRRDGKQSGRALGIIALKSE